MAQENGVIDIDAVENEIVRAGIDYWRRLKGSRAFPSMRQMAPREMGGLLRNAVLLKVINGGEDYEFCIFGEAHIQATTFNMQGSQMRDVARVWPGMVDSLGKIYGKVLETRQPVGLRAFRDDCPGVNPVASEHAVLPMGKDDSRVDHILVFSVYEPVNSPRAS